MSIRALILFFGAVLWGVAIWWVMEGANADDRGQANAGDVSSTTLSDVARRADSASEAKSKFEVTVRPGPPTPVIHLKSPTGESVDVNCSHCHATRKPSTTTRQGSDLDEFHQGLRFTHNSLSCLSCHNPEDYGTLRMADGTPVSFTNVMELCAQCHGPQYRDYLHGAHGGMTGHWDLTRGPRQRNNCVDCHHPHTPQFPKMRPTFKPRDRFLSPPSEGHARGGSSRAH